MTRNYETLDAIVIVACLLMVAFAGSALVFVEIPQNNLPVLASIATGVLGLPLAYGAFRWGNNVGAKKAQEDAAEATKTATGALAQIAGAGPPPPASPLNAAPEQATEEPSSPKG